MEKDPARLQEERDIATDAFREADEERRRLLSENAELKRLLADSTVPDLQRQVRDARVLIREMVRVIVAPLSKWQRGRRLIDANIKTFDLAVVEISLIENIPVVPPQSARN